MIALFAQEGTSALIIVHFRISTMGGTIYFDDQLAVTKGEISNVRPHGKLPDELESPSLRLRIASQSRRSASVSSFRSVRARSNDFGS